jgi:hypothetical protein
VGGDGGSIGVGAVDPRRQVTTPPPRIYVEGIGERMDPCVGAGRSVHRVRKEHPTRTATRTRTTRRRQWLQLRVRATVPGLWWEIARGGFVARGDSRTRTSDGSIQSSGHRGEAGLAVRGRSREPRSNVLNEDKVPRIWSHSRSSSHFEQDSSNSGLIETH